MDAKEKIQKNKHAKYCDELAEFIREKLRKRQQNVPFGIPEEHYVKREGGRSRADIEIDGRIGIELKVDLKGKTEMNRLMGQLSDYEDEYKCIIVVLCGEVREDTADELRYKLKKRYGATGMPAFGFGPQKPRVEIVRVKEKSQSRKKREVTKKTRSPLDTQFSPQSAEQFFDQATKWGRSLINQAKKKGTVTTILITIYHSKTARKEVTKARMELEEVVKLVIIAAFMAVILLYLAKWALEYLP